MMIRSFFDFLKNPVYQENSVSNPKYRITVFLALMLLAMGLSLLLGIGIGMLDSLDTIDFGTHSLEDLTDTYTPAFLLLAAVLLAPILEELVFRWPLVLFRDSRCFNYIFYAFTLVFGFYHLINFKVTATVLLFSPLLVAPQIIVGAILGYLRVQFGLLWAMLFHASYNFLLIGPLLLLNHIKTL